MPPLTLINIAPEEETLALAEAAPTRREVFTDIGLVAGLALAVLGLYAVAPEPRGADPLVFLLCVAIISCAHIARFDLPLAWTSPVQLALVPMLFVLPPWLVWVAFIAIMVAALVPVFYSLVLYKQLERQGKLEPAADSTDNPSQEVHAG